jgi:hypothetical protein
LRPVYETPRRRKCRGLQKTVKTVPALQFQKGKGAAQILLRLGSVYSCFLVAVVIVVIPVSIVAPAASVLVPPTMVMLPTPRASLSQFVPPVFCLRTFPSVAFRCLVKISVCLANPALASIRVSSWGRTQQHKTRKCSGGNRQFNECTSGFI